MEAPTGRPSSRLLLPRRVQKLQLAPGERLTVFSHGSVWIADVSCGTPPTRCASLLFDPPRLFRLPQPAVSCGKHSAQLLGSASKRPESTMVEICGNGTGTFASCTTAGYPDRVAPSRARQNAVIGTILEAPSAEDLAGKDAAQNARPSIMHAHVHDTLRMN